MESENQLQIDLMSLADGIPAILPEMVGFYVQSCMVCMDANNHSSGTTLNVGTNEGERLCIVNWNQQVTDDHRRAFGDLIRATDNGACAIALLLVRELTEFTAVEQAAIGTTIDYWLQRKGTEPDDKYIFNNTARLEVSGILKETSKNTIDARVAQKAQRLSRTASQPPAFVVVVEFGEPRSRIVENA